nr:helix-turn-helix domain-containing protein [Brevibacillus laterosporus]
MYLLKKKERYRSQYPLLPRWHTPEYQETLATFFQHNMQVSETARSLFLHRNTLLYRLEKVREQTSLNPRAFPEAVLLWIMLSLDKNAFKEV